MIAEAFGIMTVVANSDTCTTEEILERHDEVEQARRRTRTQGQQVADKRNKDQVATEQDIIDQMHDQPAKVRKHDKKESS